MKSPRPQLVGFGERVKHCKCDADDVPSCPLPAGWGPVGPLLGPCLQMLWVRNGRKATLHALPAAPGKMRALYPKWKKVRGFLLPGAVLGAGTFGAGVTV